MSPPQRMAMLREGRALIDITRMTLPLLWPATKVQPAQARQIIMLPGFGGDDASTWPMRRYLDKLGHFTEGWGLGRNRAGMDIEHSLEDISPSWDIKALKNRQYRGEGAVPMLCDRMAERVRQRHREVRKPLTLIGWSLGGYVAREVARDLPEMVEHVITLGSPVRGGPKYTSAAPFFRRLGLDLDWFEREIDKRESRPIIVPITAIVSPSDGVVGLGAAIDHFSPRVRHVHVDAAHVGLCFNPTVWDLVTDALEKQA